MMPIVFWASLEPWAKAMNPAENTWSRRNRDAGPAIGLRVSAVKIQLSSDHQQRRRR